MGMLAHYKLDGDATDSLRLQPTGTISGAVITLPVGCYARVGGATSGCYYFDTNTDYIGATLTYYPGPTSSVSAWGWHDSATAGNNRMLFSFNTSAGPDLYFTSSTICWNTGDGANYPFKNAGVNVTIPSAGMWHHYVVVNSREKNKCILYVDGAYYGETIFKSTAMCSIFTIGNYVSGSRTYGFMGVIDDVKIFDHALSLKEVKELYQVKLLHFTFEQQEEYTANLWTNHTSAIFSNAYNGVNYGFGSGTDLQQNAYMSNTIEKNSAITIVRRITGGTSQADYVYWGVSCAANTTRILSFWYYGSYGTAITPYCNDLHETFYYLDANGAWQGGGTTQSVPVTPDVWQRIVLKIVADATGGTFSWMILHSNQTTATVSNLESWSFTGIQVEVRDHATPFTIGTNSYCKISDSAGYGCDGTIDQTTGPTWMPTSGVLGNSCLKFNGTSTVISATCNIYPSGYSTDYPYFTACAWFKRAGTPGGGYHIILGDGAMEISIPEATGALRVGVTTTTTRYVNDFGSGLCDGNWHFVASVFTGSTLSGYIDGAYVGQIPGITGYLTNATRYIGRYTGGYYANGYIDDVRIYSSAFSADDILELYRTKARIDQYGGLKAKSFQELGPTYTRNLLPDYALWKPWQKGVSQPGFSILYGADTTMIMKNPAGADDIVWAAINNDYTSDGDGGFQTSSITVDNTKKYRFSFWVRRDNLNNGNLYFGLYSDGASHAVQLNGSADNNPYFIYTSAPSPLLGEWVLCIGYVWPASYTGTTITGGIYRIIDGGARYSASYLEFKWASGTTTASMRTYLYYSTHPDAWQYWYRPRIDLCDGSEPTIEDLLFLRENPNLLISPEAQGLVMEYTMASWSSQYVKDRKGFTDAESTGLTAYVSNFSSGTDGWSALNQSVLTGAGGILTATVTGADPYWGRSTFSFSGTTYPVIRMKFRQTGGTPITNIWILDYSATQYQKTFTFPSLTLGQWYEMDFDMTTVDSGAWVGQTITQIRMDLPNTGVVAGQEFEIESIRIEPTTPTTWLTAPCSGKAVAFNGSSQYLVFGGLGVTISAISLWIKHPASTNTVWEGLLSAYVSPYWWVGIGNGTSSYSDESLGFKNPDASLVMWLRLGETYFKDDKWHHIVISFGGVNGIWVDGVSQTVTYMTGSATTNGSFSYGNAVYLGKDYNAGGTQYPFTGQIADVRFYNRNLTQADATLLYDSPISLKSSGKYIENQINEATPTAGLIASYGFDTVMTRDDFNSYSLSISGTTPMFVPGVSPRSVAINNYTANSYLYSNAEIFRTLTEFSFSIWVKTSSLGSGQSYGGLVCITYGVRLLLDAAGTVTLATYTGGWNSLSSSGHSSLYDGNWHNIVATHSKAGVKCIYIDGILRGKVTQSPNLWNWTNAMYIGADPNNPPVCTYIGWLDEVKIYNRVLSSKEVESLYNQSPLNMYIDSSSTIFTTQLGES